MDKAGHEEAVESAVAFKKAGKDSEPALFRRRQERGKIAGLSGPKFAVTLEEGADDLFAFLTLEGADRVNEIAAGLHPTRRAVEQPGLKLGIGGNDRRPHPIEHFRMAAECSGRRAWRIEKDSIILSVGLPAERVGVDEIGIEMRSLKI